MDQKLNAQKNWLDTKRGCTQKQMQLKTASGCTLKLDAPKNGFTTKLNAYKNWMQKNSKQIIDAKAI